MYTHKKLVWAHLTLVFCAFVCRALSHSYSPWISHPTIKQGVAVGSVAIFSSLGVITGLGVLARKKQGESGVAVAVSTVLAFVLFLFSCPL